MAQKLEVILTGDSRQLEAALGKAIGQTSKFQSGLNKASVGAAAALGAIGLAAKAGFSEFADGQKVSAQTAAVLKSTGGAANVTARQIGALAEAVANYSGIDDEAVQSGQNLLLTFTGIRNEVGKGNDVFNQATRVMADMSTALGQDMKSSAIQLGKALNDPVKGITALQRVGVSFTQSQKDQIKALVESGDTMGAQKVILAELTKEFGGSAKAAGQTLPGKLAIAKNSLMNFAGELVGAALPALEQFAGWLQTVTGWMTRHQTVTKTAIGVVAGMSVAILALNVAMRVASIATAAWSAAQWLLNAAMTANPIGVAVVGVVALGAALTAAWLKSEKFRDIVTDTWEAIEDAARQVWGFVGPYIKTTLDGVLQAGRGFFNVFSGVFNAFRSAFRGDWSGMWDAIKQLASGALNALVGIIRAQFAAIGQAALDLGRLIVDRIVAGLSNVAAKVRSLIDDIPGAIRGLGGTIGAAALALGSHIVSEIGAGLASLGSRLVGWIKAPVNAVIRQVNGALARINSALSFSVDTHIPLVGKIGFDAPDIPSIPPLASGGMINASGLAYVHTGEAVVPAQTSPLPSTLGGVTVNVTVNGYVGSEQKLAEIVRRQLIRDGRRMPAVLGGLA